MDSFRILEQDTAFEASKDGSPLRAHSEQTVACFVGLQKNVDRHRIMAIVADREFANTSANDLTAVSDNGRTVIATWIWNVSCAQ